MAEVRISGPLFDGRADRAVTDFLEDARHEVSGQASADLHGYMNQYFKHPTPYYETQVNVRREPAVDVLNDRGIVYGPWLAGSGSRNRTTRFKGYPHWRRTVNDIRAKAPALIQGVLRKHLARMGG